MKNQWKKIIAASVLLSSICQAQEKNPISISSKEINTVDSNQYYKEPFRPQFHFSPKKKWMNDPNGMVFYKGTYHLFYQYYPEDIVWGPMHWGHATSTDLIHWQHKKIALFPDQLGLIFSGSAVMDALSTLINPASLTAVILATTKPPPEMLKLLKSPTSTPSSKDHLTIAL